MTCVLTDGAPSVAGGWVRAVLDQADRLGRLMRQALGLEAEIHHAGAHQLDGRRVLEVEEGHRRQRAGAEVLLVLFAQEVAHGDGNVAEIDVNRAGLEAAVADRAVVGDVVELVEMLQRNAAPRLFLVEEGLDQQRGAENLVARQ